MRPTCMLFGVTDTPRKIALSLSLFEISLVLTIGPSRSLEYGKIEERGISRHQGEPSLHFKALISI